MNSKERQFCLKFPCALKSFLLSQDTFFPLQTSFEYESFQAYRGVTREAADKTPINKTDFLSYAESGKRPRGVNVHDIGYYSCSLFLDKRQLTEALKLPRQNKRIIEGTVKCENGPQKTNKATGHVHWWLYDKADVVQDFHFWETECDG